MWSVLKASVAKTELSRHLWYSTVLFEVVRAKGIDSGVRLQTRGKKRGIRLEVRFIHPQRLSRDRLIRRPLAV